MWAKLVPYIPLLVLAATGALGGWSRNRLRDKSGDAQAPQPAMMFIGSLAACTVFAVSEPLFPTASGETRFYASLIGIGGLAGFWGLELFVRLSRRLPGFDLQMESARKEVEQSFRKLLDDLKPLGEADGERAE